MLQKCRRIELLKTVVNPARISSLEKASAFELRDIYFAQCIFVSPNALKYVSLHIFVCSFVFLKSC